MKYNKLDLKCKDIYNFPKHPGIPPSNGNFFTHSFIGARGYGKTHSTLEMMQNIDNFNFYNVYYVVSPTIEGDIKQKIFFENMEAKGRKVYYFDEFNEESLQNIRELLEYHITEWKDYKRIKDILDKLARVGIHQMNDNELFELMPYLDEEYQGNVRDILDQFPEWLKRDYPPCSYIFIDDSYGSKLLTKVNGYNPFVYLYIRHRHLFCSISLLVQSVSGIPRAIRSNTVLTCLFPTKSKKDMEILYNENANVFDSEDEFKEIMKTVASQEYGFLYLDTSSTKDPDVRIGFNQKII